MHNRPPPRLQLGFSLLELMVTVSVGAILLAIAVPSFRYMGNVNRIAAEANNLLGDLQFARSEAIREGQWVTICLSGDVGTTATPSCSTSNSLSWKTGYVVFADANNNGVIDTGEAVLRQSVPLSSSDTFVSNTGLKLISFNREGFSAALTATQYFTLHAPTTGNGWTRCVTVARTGLSSVVKYDGANCT